MAKRTPGLIKRGNVWWIHKRIRGVLIRESTGCRDLIDAERYIQHRLAEHRRVTVYGERPAVTFREASEKYLAEMLSEDARRRAEYALNAVLPYVGDLDVTMVHDGCLNEHREDRRAAGIAAGTINAEIAYTVRVLSLCARLWRHDNGRPYIDTVPMLQRVKGPKRAPQVLRWEDQPRLLAALPDPLDTMALFSLHTGVRQGECCALRWEWEVEIPELAVSLFILPAENTKARRERVVMLNSVARSLVEGQRGKHPEHLFINSRGERYPRIHGRSWDRARAIAELPTLRWHDLRHTFGHRLRAAGVGIEDRADLLGHAAGRMTTHYSAPELGRLLEAAETVVTERPTVDMHAAKRLVRG